MVQRYQCQNCGSLIDLNGALRIALLKAGFVPVNMEEPISKPVVKPAVKPVQKPRPQEDEQEENDLRLEDE